MKSPEATAVVGVACCRRELGASVGHVVFEQYLRALAGTALLPLTIPARGATFDVEGWEEAIIERLDGLILPGSPSNVAPSRYGGADEPEMALDEDRDSTTLPIISAAFRARMPILAICRGFQELNVALGGSLCPHVEQRPDSVSHRAQSDLPRAQRYEPSHALHVVEGGYLHARLAAVERDASAIEVNSLHQQGIETLADALKPEAYAEDGLVEAASHCRDGHFVLGVQWHPEWRRSRQGLDDLVLEDFEAACLAYRRRRAGQRIEAGDDAAARSRATSSSAAVVR